MDMTLTENWNSRAGCDILVMPVENLAWSVEISKRLIRQQVASIFDIEVGSIASIEVRF